MISKSILDSVFGSKSQKTTIKTILKSILMLSACVAVDAAEFVHPMDFDGSTAQKDKVIEYIRTETRQRYCTGELAMCKPATLRLMERSNLQAFKRLTQAKDRKLLDKLITDYCNGRRHMCTYNTLKLMYANNIKAKHEKLTW